MKKIITYLTLILLLAGCDGEQLYKSVMVSRVHMANLTLKSYQLDDGMTMKYYENNVQSDKTLVLLHGFTDNKETWLLFAHGLAHRYHLIIPDQIGFGESSHPSGIDYSLKKQSERLNQFLTHFPNQNFVVMGNSMGGGIALKYASNYPTKGLILLDSMGVKGEKEPYFTTLSKEQQTKYTYEVCSAEALDTLLHIFMQRVPYSPRSVLEYLSKERCARNALTKEQSKEIFDEDFQVHNDQLDEAKSINVPTLILWGKEDKMVDVSSAYKLKEVIKDSQLKVYNNVGHLPMQEIPYPLARDVRNFLR